MTGIDKKIARIMEKHYSRTLREYGATSRGVDWGSNLKKVRMRHAKMAELMKENKSKNPSILDVGCGYGAFYEYLQKNRLGSIHYTGIDVSLPMIIKAKDLHPRADFLVGDFMEKDFGHRRFDYIVCNGIFTQKLSVPEKDMRFYLRKFISKMNKLSRKGFAFNTMSSHVNFRRRHLLYMDPAELLDYVLKNVSRRVVMDHVALPYEYVCYVYK